jgi:acetyltransferase-like isoleucine patch superfamily enzyme
MVKQHRNAIYHYGHNVYHNGIKKQSQKPFTIGNHVWVCAEAHVLKGVAIGDDSIIAYRSTVTKSFSGNGSLIGGSPATLLGTNYSWGRLEE